ncbi:hypothetical protein RDI58_018508 [Solanum bulbocastanum]|uniref:Reverse transcriptase zinc-binding domain-containing protein n=1 Tax=Solanum bulbocastanum TaxID=147425 RepID=A0AAN8YD29_SOLBU
MSCLAQDMQDNNLKLSIESLHLQVNFLYDAGPTGGRRKPEASIKNNYVTLRPQYPQVEWKRLVQVKGMMPRHQFILWMTLQRKLSTVDRVLKVDANCVLCNTGHIENFDHLFYACRYSSCVWKTMLNWLGYHRQVGSWEYEVKWMISRVKNSRPRAAILGFCFAAIIYSIWIERNNRWFNAKKGSTTQRLKEIAIQVHIEGQRHINWKPHLDQLIGYPN